MRKKKSIETPKDYLPPEWVDKLIFEPNEMETLSPGQPDECRCNGEHKNIDGDLIECCCDECDYLLKCYPEFDDKRFMPGSIKRAEIKP